MSYSKLITGQSDTADHSDHNDADGVSSSSCSRRLFEVGNEWDEEELSEWCNLHFYKTIEKGITGGNPVTYHHCCFTFSKRNYSKKNTHCELSSTSIMKITAFKRMATAEQFEAWIRHQLADQVKQGKRPLFPAINRPHDVQLDLSSCHRLKTAVKENKFEELCKALLREKSVSDMVIRRLLQDNSNLQASSHSWFSRYEELIDKQDVEDELLLLQATPLKRLKTNSCSDLLSY